MKEYAVAIELIYICLYSMSIALFLTLMSIILSLNPTLFFRIIICNFTIEFIFVCKHCGFGCGTVCCIHEYNLDYPQRKEF